MSARALGGRLRASRSTFCALSVMSVMLAAGDFATTEAVTVDAGSKDTPGNNWKAPGELPHLL